MGDGYSGKFEARQGWLDHVVNELAAAHAVCLELGLPGLAHRIAAARTDAMSLQRRPGR